ncbi:MAG: DNA polymerase I [Candidatus Zixiibacteriota bacterium]
MAKNKTLYLVDGSALMYRAFYAFIRNPLINSKGEDTSATFGVVSSLLKIIREERPDYIGVIFDTKEPTFRHEMYDEYKATRAKMPSEMVAQIPRIHEAIKALNIVDYELAGYEADDIMATLADVGADKGLDVFLVTSDKDMYQIINDRVQMYLPQKGSLPPIRMDAKAVKDKIGVTPEQVIEYMALIGDSSDNVPGIPGVGPKTALKLLEDFGNLDGVLENSEKIAAKGIREKVLSNKDKALLSKKLVTIDRNVPVSISLDDMTAGQPDLDACKALFTELEFFNLLKELFGEAEIPKKVVEEKSAYKRVASIADLKALVKELSAVKEFAFDTETDGLNSLLAKLVGISLCARAGDAYYIPVGHVEQPEKNLKAEEVLKILGPLMKNKKVQKIAQNFKFDLQVMERAGYTIEPVSFDTMIASYLINPSARGHNLDNLALEYFDHTMIPITDLIGSGKKQKSFATVAPETATKYAAEDADYTYRLRGKLAPQIEERELVHLFYDIELPLIPVLSRMEQIGIRVDTDFLSKLSKDMAKDMKKITAGIYDMAGHEFNINSTKQLSEVLFEELNLPARRKTAKKTGYSTDVRVLEDLAKIHPLPKAILEFRQLTKLKSTYIDAIPELINPETGRVHTSFNQAVAATGRLSSTDPNLQNIPVRTEMGREIRKAFVARDDNHSLLVADYSQVELRILAHYSNDTSLIEAFKKGQDIHSRTAAEVFGVDLKDVTQEQRRAAKTANFAIIYGVSAYGLSQQTELNLAESKSFIDTYFERYPGIRNYIDDTIAKARDIGYVTTLMGRRRYLPDMQSKNHQVRSFAERTAINTPIQGTAADIIKLAMIKIDQAMAGMKSKMVLQVHDELVFDAHNDELDKLKNIVETNMTKAYKLRVPLTIDMGIGQNWLEAK